MRNDKTNKFLNDCKKFIEKMEREEIKKEIRGVLMQVYMNDYSLEE